MKQRTKVSIFVASLFTVLSVCGCIFTNMQANGYDAILESQEKEMSTLKSKIAVKQADQEAHSSDVITVATGLDTIRKSEDDEKAKQVFNKMFTWNSLSEYNALRVELMDSDMFSPTFFTMTYTNEIASEDRNMSVSLASVDSTCYSIDKDTGVYSYFATVKVNVPGQQGGFAVESFFFTYDVNESGNLSNVMGYVLAV